MILLDEFTSVIIIYIIGFFIGCLLTMFFGFLFNYSLTNKLSETNKAIRDISDYLAIIADTQKNRIPAPSQNTDYRGPLKVSDNEENKSMYNQ